MLCLFFNTGLSVRTLCLRCLLSFTYWSSYTLHIGQAILDPSIWYPVIKSKIFPLSPSCLLSFFSLSHLFITLFCFFLAFFLGGGSVSHLSPHPLSVSVSPCSSFFFLISPRYITKVCVIFVLLNKCHFVSLCFKKYIYVRYFTFLSRYVLYSYM